MRDEIDRPTPRRSDSGSEPGPAALGRLRPASRVPALLSVALIAVVIGLLVGFGSGYRLGGIVPAPTPTPTASPVPPDVEPDSVSARLEEAFASAAPGGWAVCDVGPEVGCQPLTAVTTEPRVPPSEYGLGWYANRELTRVHLSPAHLVLAAAIGQGAVAARLYPLGPGDMILDMVRLTPVNPGRSETFYFDLGSLTPGHYVVEAEYQVVPASASEFMLHAFVVGFVVA
jgi:hypothetical protein